jgi:tRNA (cmo5U34)-methyltransferase
MIGEIAGDYAVDATQLYDLGCSTANALIQMDPVLPAAVGYVGIDFPMKCLTAPVRRRRS